MERLHILDGYGYIFRAFYGLATSGPERRGVRLSNAAGMPTGALYVYARMLIRLHKEVKPERIAVVFDAPGKTFRHELDAQYKATRRETPAELVEQLPHFRPLTEAFCWPVLSVAGVEADDVIATLVAQARARDWGVVIHSADKDLMQLVDDQVTVTDALRQVTYDAGRVTEKFGVPPAQLRDWLALVGDKSDNVPGMPGVGKKTAAKLLGEFESIDGILANVDSMKGKQKERFSDPALLEQLERSRVLVTLKSDVTTGVELDELVPTSWDGTRLRDLFGELEFSVLLESMDLAVSGASKSADPQESPAAAESEAAVSLPPILATELAPLEEVIAAARSQQRVAIEVVTDGARADRQRLVGFALAAEAVAPVYVPLAHRYLSAPTQLAVAELPDSLAQLLTDPSIAVLCHDAKSARRALRSLGIELATVALDSLLAAYLLDEPSELDKIAARHAKLSLSTRIDLCGKGKKAVEFESVPVEAAAAFVGGNAAALLAVRPGLEAHLAKREQGGLLVELEQPLAILLADVEERGIILDTAYLRELGDRVGGQIAALEREAFAAAGEEINLGSPKQLSALLFDRLGLHAPRMKRTKTGFSTDHEVLESMIDLHPLIKFILEHRELVKLKGTYIDALPPLVNPTTGRLHTSFNQAVAATGRLSSQEPNLQNIPIRTELGREIRRAFVAGPGKLLVSADYSQIELRILAHLSGDEVLLRAFREGIDVHRQTASEVFGIALDEVGATERRVAKAVNYGLAYGQSEFGLARALDIPRKQASFYIETYFQRFSRVRDFMDELIARARREGGATTLLGRYRPILDIDAKNYQRRTAAERVAQNTPMQGSGADILKLAMLAADKDVAASGLDAAMLLTVHDELVFEVAAEQADELAVRVTEVMESVYKLDVPLIVDVGKGPTWADAH